MLALLDSSPHFISAYADPACMCLLLRCPCTLPTARPPCLLIGVSTSIIAHQHCLSCPARLLWRAARLATMLRATAANPVRCPGCLPWWACTGGRRGWTAGRLLQRRAPQRDTSPPCSGARRRGWTAGRPRWRQAPLRGGGGRRLRRGLLRLNELVPVYFARQQHVQHRVLDQGRAAQRARQRQASRQAVVRWVTGLRWHTTRVNRQARTE